MGSFTHRFDRLSRTFEVALFLRTTKPVTSVYCGPLSGLGPPARGRRIPAVSDRAGADRAEARAAPLDAVVASERMQLTANYVHRGWAGPPPSSARSIWSPGPMVELTLTFLM